MNLIIGKKIYNRSKDQKDFKEFAQNLETESHCHNRSLESENFGYG